MWITEYKTKKGKKYTFHEATTINGKRKEVSISFDNKTRATQKIAREELFRLISELKNEPKDMPFFDLFDLFLKDREQSIKASTAYCDRSIEKKLKELLPETIRISELKPRLLQEMVNDIVKNNTVGYARKIFALISKALLFGERLDYIHKVNVISKIVIPRAKVSLEKVEKERNKFLTKDELIDVLEQLKKIDFKLSLVCEFQALTGLRYGELIALRIQDYDKEKKEIYVNGSIALRGKDFYERGTPKNIYSIRHVTLDDRADEIIRLFISKAKETNWWSNKSVKIEDMYIFATANGKPIDRSYMNAKLRQLKSKKAISTHIFRHTHISMLAEQNVPLKAIMQRVGHNDPQTTLKVYTHTTEEMKKAADAAINTIGQRLRKTE